MPSPFPGMDPWLEGHYWTTIHAVLGSQIAHQLARQVIPKYSALGYRKDMLGIPGDAGVTWVERVPHCWVEIRRIATRELVTVIEFRTPANKREPAQWRYLRRRRYIFSKNANLLEIDLLRKGDRVLDGCIPHCSYVVTLDRAGKSKEVWPIQLTDALPAIPVPLGDNDPDAVLDLQLAFSTCYDDFGYRYALSEYGSPPDVPLTPGETVWAKECLRSAGYEANW